MGKIITQCPSCGSTKVQATKVECAGCGTKFEGTFDIPALLRLPDDELRFILDFVRLSGSLKDMAESHGVSYPTMRNRLNAIIKAIESIDKDKSSEKDKILSLLESGKISAAEAAKRLRKM